MSQPKREKNKAPFGGGPMGGMMPGEKAKDFRGSLGKLADYLKPYTFLIGIVVVFAIVSTVFTILGPNILGDATTEIFEGLMRSISGAGEGINFDIVGSIIVKLLILYGISSIFSYLQGHSMAYVTTKVSYNLRTSIMEKINKLPISYFHKTSQGDVLSRITNDIDTLNQSLNQSITQSITSVTSIIGVLIMMFSISWKMTLIALGIIPVSFILVILMVNLSQKHFKGQQEYLGTDRKSTRLNSSH